MDQVLTGPLTDAAEVVTLNKEDALEKFNEYKAALRVSRSQHDRMMKAVYGALSQGLGVINPRAAIIKAGLDANNYPKLAICRADHQIVYFRRRNQQEAAFSAFSGKYLSGAHKTAQESRLQFYFAGDTLPKVEPKRTPMYRPGTAEIAYYRTDFPRGYFAPVKATVPIIPPAHRPSDHALNQYCILWKSRSGKRCPGRRARQVTRCC
jgi:hypothetical protein